MFFLFQAEDGIRDLVRSRGIGDVYKRQGWYQEMVIIPNPADDSSYYLFSVGVTYQFGLMYSCLLYTSDAADERSSVDLGGRRIIKKTNR